MTEMPETTETQEPELFDVVIPPGVPQVFFREIIDRFPNATLVESRQPMRFANMDGDVRELLAFRADYETAQAIEQHLYDYLKEFIGDL
ncbi:MAG: hypothetical protein GXY82_07955 [Methanospirillum sp.]|nr:hypothetical protein [Methanospirillum sp.]